MEKMEQYEREHFDTLRELAPECAVLLKRRGDFPLEAPGKIALYGSGGRRTVKGGTGSGDVNSRFYITCEQGLRDAGFTVTTQKWLDGYDAVMNAAHISFIAGIKERAKREHKSPFILGMGAVMTEPEYDLPLEGEGDTAVYVLARNSGEGNDRTLSAGDYMLTGTEIRDILAANERYEHFMLVLNVGGPVDLTPVLKVDNILLLSQLGVVTGTVLADILLGRAQPSGKLATTWAAAEELPKLGDFGGDDETRYKEGIYVGYRYYESAGVKPVFPFGYGLGYTDFSYGAARLELEGHRVQVTVPVFNSGAFPGKETVQVYVSVPWGKLDQPVKTLAGYSKTGTLLPGEAQGVKVCFDMAELAAFDEEKSAYVLEKGRYTVFVGRSSDDTAAAGAVELTGDVTLREVEHVGGKPDFEDWRPEHRKTAELPERAKVLKLDPGAFSDIRFPECAKPSEKALETAGRLSDEELILMCCGRFSGSLGIDGIIGSASLSVAGAAGETCGSIKGIRGLVMADGPAGLRLAKRYYIDKRGVPQSVDSTLPAGFEELMNGASKMLIDLTRKKPTEEIRYQFCTAIPIGTAIAQSWNTELARSVGVIVGEEMERFGVDLWLAPALNIHRSPLCGRNFEYYSEDPLISGRTAAAVTLGVQSRPGRGVTIKHFCCNNQETNRYCSNSILSERALRETYIRGFGICIAEANPAAVMTSYNLLNGTHTSEREDLSAVVLRREWGWRGLIMTDWVMSVVGDNQKYPVALSAPTIAAGNIFMPGSRSDWRAALKELKRGALPREKAVRCASQVIDLVDTLG